MTNEQKLKELIELAVSRGYFHAYYGQMNDFENRDHGWYNPGFVEDNKHFKIIFSHDFAKAVYGEDDTHPVTGKAEDLPTWEWIRETIKIKDWQFHLQQQVLRDDPLDYMYNNRTKQEGGEI